MFFYILAGVFVFLIIGYLLAKNISKKNKKVNHYFILVENGQGKLEWIIRSINFRSWLSGEEKKLTVFDLGSDDDTLAILERLIYPKKLIDYLYTDKDLIGTKIDESKKNNEIPIILYVNSREKELI